MKKDEDRRLDDALKALFAEERLGPAPAALKRRVLAALRENSKPLDVPGRWLPRLAYALLLIAAGEILATASLAARFPPQVMVRVRVASRGTEAACVTIPTPAGARASRPMSRSDGYWEAVVPVAVGGPGGVVEVQTW